jgi:hypothetical protein
MYTVRVRSRPLIRQLNRSHWQVKDRAPFSHCPPISYARCSFARLASPENDLHGLGEAEAEGGGPLGHTVLCGNGKPRTRFMVACSDLTWTLSWACSSCCTVVSALRHVRRHWNGG